MITVATFRNINDADAARIRLAAHGINAVIADEAFSTVGYGGMVIDIRLQVDDADAERAHTVLAAEATSALPDDFDPGPEEADTMATDSGSGGGDEAYRRLLARKVDNGTLLVLAAICMVCLYIGFTCRDRGARSESPSPWDGVAAAVARLDFERAVTLARPLVNLYPEDVHYRAYMTYLYVVAGDLENAEIEARLTYQLAPTDEHKAKLHTIQRLRQERSQRGLGLALFTPPTGLHARRSSQSEGWCRPRPTLSSRACRGMTRSKFPPASSGPPPGPPVACNFMGP